MSRSLNKLHPLDIAAPTFLLLLLFFSSSLFFFFFLLYSSSSSSCQRFELWQVQPPDQHHMQKKGVWLKGTVCAGELNISLMEIILSVAFVKRIETVVVTSSSLYEDVSLTT